MQFHFIRLSVQNYRDAAADVAQRSSTCPVLTTPWPPSPEPPIKLSMVVHACNTWYRTRVRRIRHSRSSLATLGVQGHLGYRRPPISKNYTDRQTSERYLPEDVDMLEYYCFICGVCILQDEDLWK